MGPAVPSSGSTAHLPRQGGYRFDTEVTAMGLLDWFRRDRTARERAERDAPGHNAGARETGGADSGPGTEDTHSTTGTTENGEFVGRAGGDEAGEDGAEPREERGEG